MKIEKVNENQIRCTLSKEDLEDRQIKLSELAYGSEKAKGLFRDMIQQANHEFGFETEDAPIMVEAIPLPGDHIILQITKVEYLEEQDDQFEEFKELEDDEELAEEEAAGEEDAILKLSGIKEAETDVEEPTDLVKMFEFASMDTLKRVAKVLSSYYFGTNSVYKDLHKNGYYLLLHKDGHTPEEFHKVCNMISEYGSQKKYYPAVEGYLKEHGKCILNKQALQILHSL